MREAHGCDRLGFEADAAPLQAHRLVHGPENEDARLGPRSDERPHSGGRGARQGDCLEAYGRHGAGRAGRRRPIAKPKVPGKAAKWNPKTRGLEKPPRGHLDDRANFDDGKDNTTRPIGTQARFETTHGGRSRSQLRVWCVCDESKAADDKHRHGYKHMDG